MPNELSTLPHTQQGFCRKPSSVRASAGGFFVLCVLRVPAWSGVWPMGAPESRHGMTMDFRIRKCWVEVAAWCGL